MPPLPWPQFMRNAHTLWAVVAVMIVLLFIVKAPRRGALDIRKRGVLVVEHESRTRRARRRLSRRVQPVGVTLCGHPVTALDECKHFKMIGTTGTGKSTAIRELLGGALARGDRAVFADPDGGYRGHFFKRFRSDVILNPFDSDSVRWDPFGEINAAYDADELAAGLIPASGDAAANEWRGYARTFVAAVLRRCHERATPCAAELWRLIAVAPAEVLRGVVAETPAQPFLDPDNARMFGSIRAVAVSSLAAFEYVQSQRAPPFSVRHWVRSARGGALFIPYRAGQIASLRAMIATWLRLAIFETMNGAENHDQRLWFVVDELDALGAIHGLKDALARLRKFGGRCVLGFQSVAQVSGTYGAPEAQTIVENCGNTLILRCSASENGGTSQFASRLVGEREVIRRQTTRGSDRGSGWANAGSRRSRNVTDQHVTELAVMASQIEQLPDLHGYLRLASSPVWQRAMVDRDQPRSGTHS